MEVGEEIDHADVVAPLTSGRTYVPQALHILTGQRSVFFTFAIGQGKGSYGIGSGHTFGVGVGCSRTVEIELTVTEAVVLEEAEQAAHHGALTFLVLTRKVVIHTYVHGATDGIVLIARGVIEELRTLVRCTVEQAIVGEKSRHRIGRSIEQPTGTVGRFAPEGVVRIGLLSSQFEEGGQTVRGVAVPMHLFVRHKGHELCLHIVEIIDTCTWAVFRLGLSQQFVSLAGIARFAPLLGSDIECSGKVYLAIRRIAGTNL